MSNEIVKATADQAIEKYQGQKEFIKEHGLQLVSLEGDYKTLDEVFELIEKLPDDVEQKENLFNILRRLNPNKKGVVSDRAASFHADLRLFHGVGNDPNRPSELRPGEMYFSSGDTVGSEFIGTPLFIWTGRELVDKGEDGEMGNRLCISQDRIVGDTRGYCKDCTYLPFRKDVKNEIYCRNFICAFMLSQDGREIVLVRFNKTSEPAGRQLLQYAQRTPALWTRWYSIRTESQTNATKKNKWYVYKVEPLAGDAGRVIPALHPICEAFYASAGREYVFPLIARTYADMAREDSSATSTTAAVVTESTDTGLNYANINEDA